MQLVALYRQLSVPHCAACVPLRKAQHQMAKRDGSDLAAPAYFSELARLLLDHPGPHRKHKCVGLVCPEIPA